MIRAILAFAIAVGGLLLIKAGLYGMTLFIVLPVCLGAVSVGSAEPRSAWRAALTGGGVAGVACFSLLLLGKEGLICIFMALPLAAPLGVLGGLLFHSVSGTDAATRGSALLLLIPAGTIGFDIRATPPVYEVAPPSKSMPLPPRSGTTSSPSPTSPNRTSGSSAPDSPIPFEPASKAPDQAPSAIASSPPDHSLSRSRSGTPPASSASASRKIPRRCMSGARTRTSCPSTCTATWSRNAASSA